MATSKKIVDIRKLNEKNKARLGRGGDTKIRTVDGKKSHVNAFEAYMIDVEGKAGEEYTKKVGSGTINPYTGMPEYQEKTYEELAAMSPYEYERYLGDMGIAGQTTTYTTLFGETIGEETGKGTRGFVGNLSDLTDDPELAYIRAQQEFVTGSAADYLGRGGTRGTAGTARDLAERGLGAAKELGMEELSLGRQQREQGLGQAEQFAMQGAGRQYQTQTAGLARGLESGQRAAGRGLAQAGAAAQSAAGRSGLVTGSAQAGFESQRRATMAESRDISKQYQAGRSQASAGLGMAQKQSAAAYGLGMQQTAATEALGMKKLGSAYDIGMAGAAASYESAVGGAKVTADYQTNVRQKQLMDKFWGQMAEYGDPNLKGKVLGADEYAAKQEEQDFWYEEG